MRKWALRFLKVAYIGLIASLPIAALANYAATVGAGTNFGSFDVGGVKFPGFVISDATTPTQGAAVNASGQLSVNIAAGLNSNGQATMANSAPVVIASNQSAVPVTLASTTITGNPASNTAQVNGVTVLTGTGATGTGAQRVTVSTDQATNAGAALVKGGVGVVNGGSFYQAVAASQTATVLQSSTGATGDYLSHCVLYPTSTSPGVVTVFDNTNAAAGSAILFPGGATSLSNLAPISIPIGAVSTAGAWKVTTGASISVVCYGKFS